MEKLLFPLVALLAFGGGDLINQCFSVNRADIYRTAIAYKWCNSANFSGRSPLLAMLFGYFKRGLLQGSLYSLANVWSAAKVELCGLCPPKRHQSLSHQSSSSRVQENHSTRWGSGWIEGLSCNCWLSVIFQLARRLCLPAPVPGNWKELLRMPVNTLWLLLMWRCCTARPAGPMAVTGIGRGAFTALRSPPQRQLRTREQLVAWLSIEWCCGLLVWLLLFMGTK